MKQTDRKRQAVCRPRFWNQGKAEKYGISSDCEFAALVFGIKAKQSPWIKATDLSLPPSFLESRQSRPRRFVQIRESLPPSFLESRQSSQARMAEKKYSLPPSFLESRQSSCRIKSGNRLSLPPSFLESRQSLHHVV